MSFRWSLTPIMEDLKQSRDPDTGLTTDSYGSPERTCIHNEFLSPEDEMISLAFEILRASLPHLQGLLQIIKKVIFDFCSLNSYNIFFTFEKEKT